MTFTRPDSRVTSRPERGEERRGGVIMGAEESITQHYTGQTFSTVYTSSTNKVCSLSQGCCSSSMLQYLNFMTFNHSQRLLNRFSWNPLPLPDIFMLKLLGSYSPCLKKWPLREGATIWSLAMSGRLMTHFWLKSALWENSVTFWCQLELSFVLWGLHNYWRPPMTHMTHDTHDTVSAWPDLTQATGSPVTLRAGRHSGSQIFSDVWCLPAPSKCWVWEFENKNRVNCRLVIHLLWVNVVYILFTGWNSKYF